ncbi:MAG: TIGR03960 family B12-binding radical SAM protein [Thermodesulfobacteriota bacterium]
MMTHATTRFDPGELFLAVKKPSRYTGGELNARRKGDAACRLRFALAFPDTYEVGMSHLGLQVLYAILNGLPDVACERCYAPWPDMEAELRRRRLPLVSLESQRPLSAFDMVGFSLQYELSYTNVLMMLDLGGIPLRRDQRGDGHPLVIAGGPCAFNPAPMSDFIDAFVIGEGEEAVAEIAASVLAVRDGGGGRQEQLEALAGIGGVYVPGVHTRGERIAKRIISDLDAWRVPLCPIVPLMKTIHDRVTLEIARGCTRGCRFCQAGMVWRPVRERTPAVIEEMAEAMLRATGHDELSLLSLSSGDYTLIEPLIKTLIGRYYARRVALALPSLRVETLTTGLIEAVRRVRKTSFTLAPEAGTSRLRQVINKGNTEEELLETTTRVFAAGWKSVKLYFMIGLPGEREDDLEGIAELARKALLTARNRGQITVSLSTFVPKPHTPFQWHRQIGIAEVLARQAFFRHVLKNRNITVKWHDAHMGLLEGVLSRGDERAGALIETAFHLGCRFDGWSDRLRYDLWEAAFRRTGMDPAPCLDERPVTGVFPWEQVDAGVTREFLLAEAGRAERGEPTTDCRTGACIRCGACQGHIQRVIAPADAPIGSVVSSYAGPEGREGQEKAFRIRFTKLGPARFLSHLELASALSRAVSVAGLSFIYSQGYHPHPKISFAGATSVGMASLGEYADIRIQDPRDAPGALLARINAALPEGMRITAMNELPPRTFSLAELVVGFSYDLILPEDERALQTDQIEGRIREFLAADRCLATRQTDGKPVIKDIRPFVTGLALDRTGHQILLSVRFGPGGTVRPAEVLTAVAGIAPELCHRIGVLKTGTQIAEFAGVADRNLFSTQSS